MSNHVFISGVHAPYSRAQPLAKKLDQKHPLAHSLSSRGPKARSNGQRRYAPLDARSLTVGLTALPATVNSTARALGPPALALDPPRIAPQPHRRSPRAFGAHGSLRSPFAHSAVSPAQSAGCPRDAKRPSLLTPFAPPDARPSSARHRSNHRTAAAEPLTRRATVRRGSGRTYRCRSPSRPPGRCPGRGAGSRSLD